MLAVLLLPHAYMICLLSSYKLFAQILLERMISHKWKSNARPVRGFDPHRL